MTVIFAPRSSKFSVQNLGAPFLAGAIKRPVPDVSAPRLFVSGGHTLRLGTSNLIGRFLVTGFRGDRISMSYYAALLLLPLLFQGIVDELGHVGRFRSSTISAETLRFVSNGAFLSSSAWKEELSGKGEDILGLEKI